MSSYATAISELFRSHENPGQAVRMKAYLRNQFEFFGLQGPERRELQKQFIAQEGIPATKELAGAVRALWEMPQRELQYFAMELMGIRMKEMDRESIPLVEELICWKSWWDSVDYLSPTLMGGLMKKYPGEILERNRKWLASGNIWLQRTSLLFQLKYKQETDLDLLYSTIEYLRLSKEFFIQKAIGWILREYSKTDPQSVINYVENTSLSPLSRREALKVIQRKQKDPR